MLNAPSKHAIRALICLAEHKGDEFVPVKDLAEESGVPFAYLSKLIKSLAENELVQTKKGSGGGVMLGGKPVSFYEVCEVFGDSITVSSCFLSGDQCNLKSPCPFHESWSVQRENIARFLKRNKIRRKRS